MIFERPLGKLKDSVGIQDANDLLATISFGLGPELSTPSTSSKAFNSITGMNSLRRWQSPTSDG
jgi:hypothetical protein